MHPPELIILGNTTFAIRNQDKLTILRSLKDVEDYLDQQENQHKRPAAGPHHPPHEGNTGQYCKR